MAIKGAGGRLKITGKNLTNGPWPDEGTIIASAYPQTTTRRMRRPALTNLHDDHLGQSVYAAKATKTAP